MTLDVLARALDDDIRDDPYPYLAWLRENHPVHQGPAGFYLVATHADCLAVTANAERFRGPHEHEIPELFPLASRYSAVAMLVDALAMKNPPAHSRLRRLYNRDFTARHVDKMRADTALRCAQILDDVEAPLRDGEAVDAYERITRLLPQAVLADLLGLPESDRGWLFDRFLAVLSTFVPGVTVEMLDAAQKASDEVRDYMVDLIDLRRRTPAEGLLSDWVQVHHNDPDTFSYPELLSMLWGLVAGGVDTTASALSNGVLAMLRHPEHNSWLLDDARAYANEVLRHESPSFVAGIPRFAVADTELSGVLIPAGSDVRTLLGAANRDPAVFPDPDRFDPARDTAKSLSFGRGIHFCLGANVALQELTTLLPALHQRFPALRLADRPRWRRSLPVRAIEKLPVALDI
ncbi:cytochrome P450 [Kutzneria sp. CA-103260]|uniref:cytochrome P450 n=1 Tax=Kutzneria sp. CA-103260 TaxID=2802641 RepID=UPI001BA8539C|nr:cytochrome P450 [Kutzneria sp. CA-103260]QUQ63509.1 cytochrome P450 [Kutzneria sp. CA-103260]